MVVNNLSEKGDSTSHIKRVKSVNFMPPKINNRTSRKFKIKEREAEPPSHCVRCSMSTASFSLSQLSFLFPFGEEISSKSKHMLLAFPLAIKAATTSCACRRGQPSQKTFLFTPRVKSQKERETRREKRHRAPIRNMILFRVNPTAAAFPHSVSRPFHGSTLTPLQ